MIDMTAVEVPDDMDELVAEQAVEGAEADEIETILAPRAPAPSIAAAPIEHAATHALDRAPVNSKIVIVLVDEQRRAVLATPNGVERLPADDPAAKLPDGACIKKVAEGRFISEQLNPAIDHDPRVSETAGEAISGFVAYFHGSD